MEHLIKLITVFKDTEKDILSIKDYLTKLENIEPSVIFRAINTGSFKLVSLLLGYIDHTVLKQLKTPRGRTPLVIAVKYPRFAKRRGISHAKATRKALRIIVLLLGVGIPVDEVDGGGRTALMWAAVSGSSKIVQTLIEHGASLTAVSKRKKMPHQYAKSYDIREILAIEKEEDITITSSENIVEEQCCICLSQPATVAFMPCKHQCVCKGCAKKLDRCRYSMSSSQELKSVSKKCPICRVRYTNTCAV